MDDLLARLRREGFNIYESDGGFVGWRIVQPTVRLIPSNEILPIMGPSSEGEGEFPDDGTLLVGQIFDITTRFPALRGHGFVTGVYGEVGKRPMLRFAAKDVEMLAEAAC